MSDMQELTGRTKRLTVFLFLIFLILSGRLWYLQIMHGDDFLADANGNRIRFIPLVAPRGRIYDRNGMPLALNRKSFTVSIVPGGLGKQETAILTRLSPLLDMSVEDLRKILREGGSPYPYEPVRLKRDVGPDTVIAIEEKRMDLPGVIIEEEPVREYPQGDTAGLVLGYLSLVSPKELAGDGGYRATDLTGKYGLEKYYENRLRGTAGKEYVEVNALQRPVGTLDVIPPVPGDDLVLTIDSQLQSTAEKAMTEHLARIRDLHDEDDRAVVGAGAVVVLNVKTGEVLTLASVPDINPNNMLGPERSKYYQSLLENPLDPLLNRAIRGRWAPGSIFKPITAVTALEQGAVTPGETYNATGRGKHGKRDWTLGLGLPPAGVIDVSLALARSSNDFFWEMALRPEVGIANLSRYARKFGLGKATGIDLYPAEYEGLIPDRQWKRQAYADRPRWEQTWYESETMDVAIGQGAVEVTPLQMALVFEAVANHGVAYRPHLVQEIRSPAADPGDVVEPTVLFKVDAHPSTWKEVTGGLRKVVTDSRGTARNAFAGFPIPIAGKTGSAQVPLKPAHGWFAGFAPFDDPEIVVVVFTQYGGGGASAAAPIARRVFESYFHVQESPDVKIDRVTGD